MQGLHGPLWRLEKVEMHVLATVTELCSAELRGEVLDDMPHYHSTLRQVHTHRHTDILYTYKHMHAHTQQRPGLPVQVLLVSGIQSTLWANGQTKRVNSGRSERRSESICCLRSPLIACTLPQS